MARRSDIPNVEINLIRILDVLQGLITPALCQAAFALVRTTERQRKWSLEALVRFWTAVILRAPKALTQALVDSVEQRDVVFPKVDASPAAFFQRCRDLRPGLLRRGLSPVHRAPARAGGPALCRAHGGDSDALCCPRAYRRLASGCDRPWPEDPVGRAGRGPARVSAGPVRSEARPVPRPVLLGGRRGRRDSAPRRRCATWPRTACSSPTGCTARRTSLPPWRRGTAGG